VADNLLERIEDWQNEFHGERRYLTAAYLLPDVIAAYRALAAKLAAVEAESAPYWLCTALADHVVSGGASSCDREGIDCDDTELCVSEYCAPCAAKWWLDKQAAPPAQQEAE
jgi:hypothetical protein